MLFRSRAVENLSFTLRRGEVLGLVGESGSGKSTAARCIMNLYRPQSGQVFYRGLEVSDPRVFRKNRRMLQTARQLIFQASGSSLDPRMAVWELITEPLRIHRLPPPRGSLWEEAAVQLSSVGLDRSVLEKYPGQLSGGQRQRVAIARALTTEPELLVADEPLSSLDVSAQAQIVNLFRSLQGERGFSLLFIAHDLSMVEYLCSRVGLAPTGELFRRPLHPYTRALLSAIPLPDPRRERGRQRTEAEEFSLAGELEEAAPGHFVLREGRDRG